MDDEHKKRLDFSLMYFGITGVKLLMDKEKADLAYMAGLAFGKTFEARVEDFVGRPFPEQSVDEKLLYADRIKFIRGLNVTVSGQNMHPDLLSECLDAARFMMRDMMPESYILNKPLKKSPPKIFGPTTVKVEAINPLIYGQLNRNTARTFIGPRSEGHRIDPKAGRPKPNRGLRDVIRRKFDFTINPAVAQPKTWRLIPLDAEYFKYMNKAAQFDLHHVIIPVYIAASLTPCCRFAGG